MKKTLLSVSGLKMCPGGTRTMLRWCANFSSSLYSVPPNHRVFCRRKEHASMLSIACCRSKIERKSSRLTTRKSECERATQLAARGSALNSARSPKVIPALISPTVSGLSDPFCRTCTSILPLTTMKNLSPLVPCRMTYEFFSTLMNSATRAIRCCVAAGWSRMKLHRNPESAHRSMTSSSDLSSLGRWHICSIFLAMVIGLHTRSDFLRRSISFWSRSMLLNADITVRTR
mmetsp:Transcript_69169/g.218819  ORF Transcript_69169/g.218819 Transcript_69169/m.218819 type:complete len:231 (-) Transcript_69169:554-1246(-)